MPLGVLFLDLNAYFASCEQQEDPSLRGRPIAVAPVASDSTCAIAASYEAKRFGIKTGTNIGEAKRLCPDLVVVPGRPNLYVHIHQKVLTAVESVLPIEKVCSIDEMRCRLLGKEREPAEAIKLAHRIKGAILDGAGECMTCSVGIAPNSFLAKLGTDLQKPNGLIVLHPEDLPKQIEHLKLTEFCGINRRMAARLEAAGIFTVNQLYAASPQELRAAFGSIVGERWYGLLRGHESDLKDRERQSLSHSHVLAPELRTDRGCREVLLRLIQKASARLRADGWCTSSMSVTVRGKRKSWHDQARLDATNDTVAINELFLRLWAKRDFESPFQVGVAFTNLTKAGGTTPSLFEDTLQRDRLNQAVDSVNQKFGKNSIFLAGMQGGLDAAPERIAFHKTDLFSEGKDDNMWHGD